MKRQWKAILCLLLLLAMLSSCAPNNNSQGETFDEVTQNLGPSAEPTEMPPAELPPENNDSPSANEGSMFARSPFDLPDDFDNYDPLLEEDYTEDGFEDDYPEASAPDQLAAYANADPNATPYPYAGSTPIPLNPIDMPSPTPKPPLSFEYVDYSIATLGLIFKGPRNWIPDESDPSMFVLSEPDGQIKDGQLGIIKIHALPVTSDFNESALKADINDRLNVINSEGFSQWRPSLTATRHLMGVRGVYANYSGTLSSGVQIGGRVHSVSMDNMLYTIEIVYPLGFKTDYEKIFVEMRSTLKRQ